MIAPSNVISFPARKSKPVQPKPGVTTTEYFGGCPICGHNDGYLNVGRGHWFVCDKHELMWFGGANIFSDHWGQSEAEQRKLFARVEHYRDAEPVYPAASGGRP